VKQGDLGECEEKKQGDTNIQSKSQAPPPPNQAIGMANTELPQQRSKMRRIEGFGENVGQLPLCVNKLHLYLSLLNMVSQKVVSHFDVFGSPMKNWIMS
jgi:hypothetical protein